MQAIEGVAGGQLLAYGSLMPWLVALRRQPARALVRVQAQGVCARLPEAPMGAED